MADHPTAFVTGFPIRHSRSPLIHGHWLKKYGLDGSYQAIEVAPEGFADFVHNLQNNGFVGGNVTIPHKESAFALCSRHDTAAMEIGAVNTLWFEDGVLWGGNTDAYGFVANLDAMSPRWDERKSALVLGAGGASRAVVYALKQRGFTDIRIVNRTVERAKELADRLGCGISAHEWRMVPELLGDSALIVNTTSLGMEGKADESIDLTAAAPDALVTDIVYVPLETPLLKTARARGLKTVDGLGMLLHQAVPGFERWFGTRPDVTPELRKVILADMDRSARSGQPK
ncbi:shikimate dehydrogenase [Phyllobacterium brassicacearum]|uniref:Shikimate dehydrogenase (NADP(+)) n=1 Tax=Phyllobacterium brassicacearum TaxID=314235 RepID=A0A2P7BBI7_9HYPH|nr:shikimate dehydrogenase [Phyllobacterium brassicacearum]PSH63831.1 shikimate dehydrogenase [Phyllobacterium brassicacearum]TDQ20103.1 shikimate dehydrogenase [Phyllobacterium brassicacearum]